MTAPPWPPPPEMSSNHVPVHHGPPPGPANHPAPRRSRRGLWFGALAVLVLAGAATTGLLIGQHAQPAAAPVVVQPTVPAVPATFALTGQLTVIDSDTTSSFSGVQASGGSCKGQNGFSDLSEGTPVTVKNSVGTIVGSTSLSIGIPNGAGRCQFWFTMAGVKSGGGFYQIEIGRRGAVTFPEDKAKYGVTMTIGS